jgi:hypothetical protein
MKKLTLLIIIILSALLLQARVMGQFGIGLDLNGKQSFSNALFSHDSDVKTGASLYGEALMSQSIVLGDLLFGGGLEYQLPRELDKVNEDLRTRKISSLPMYLTGKFVLNSVILSPELIVRAGYDIPITQDNFKYTDVNGGLYWAMGAGIGFKPLVLQLMYKSSQNSFSWKEDIDLPNLKATSTNSQLSIQLGIRL